MSSRQHPIAQWAADAPLVQVVGVAVGSVLAVAMLVASAIPHTSESDLDTAMNGFDQPASASVPSSTVPTAGSDAGTVDVAEPPAPEFTGSPVRPSVGGTALEPSPSTPSRSPASLGGSGGVEGPIADDGRAVDRGPGSEAQIVMTMWASRHAGTPIGRAGVPDGSLPVGNRLGQLDKATYLRFTGGTRLLLVEDGDGRRQAPAAEPAVQACQLLESGWEPGEETAFDRAPAHDEGRCAPGVHGAGGVWTFQVDGLDGSRGVVLIPSPQAPLDFQVAFRTE